MVDIDTEHLPEGDEKVRAVRSMFDAIAPRYDLVNRVMTFRMDVGWRRRTVRDLRLGPGSLRRRPGLWHRRLLPRARRPRVCGRSGSTCRSACSPTPGPPPPSPRPTSSACRCPTRSLDGITCGFALRNLVELGAVLRRAGPGRPTRRTHRPARGGHAAEPGAAMGPRHLLRQGRADGRRAAVRPRRLPVPAEVGGLPPRARRRCSPTSATPGSCRSSARLLSTGVAQLITATRRKPGW